MKRELKYSMIVFFCACISALSAQAQDTAGTAGEVSKLSGTPIGSVSIDYKTNQSSETINIPANAFDGELETYYASYGRSNTYVGLDLGTPHVISRVGWCSRSGQARRVQLGLFEASNDPNFLDAVPLYLVPEIGADRQMFYADVHVSRSFRYVRYVGPHDARCNIAELEFYGYEGTGDDSRFYQITNLPTLSIHTYSGIDPQDKVTDLEANFTLVYDGGGKIQEYPILTRGRGNASWSFPKKPYRIKFNDGKSHHMMKGSAQESPAKAKKWTLINNYGDKTLMRNILAFEISKRLNMEYTPYCQPVDVIMNGEYKGCYQLCDQITVDPNRVNVTEMETWDTTEPTLSGGYMVEVDAYASDEISWFTSTRGIPVTIKSPDEEDITTEQYNYIKNYFNLLESKVYSNYYRDPETGYRSLLDVESFVKHFIVGEFSGNTDTYWSTYMYKNREEDQFKVGPCWDYDLAFENDSRIYPVNNRADWIFRSGGSGAGSMSSMVSRILSDSYADKRLKETWATMRTSGKFKEDSLLSFVDSISQVLDASQHLNFIRWPILNSMVHQNVSALGSYEAEVNVIRNFLPKRIKWIDDFLGFDINGGFTPVYEDSTFHISTPEQLIEFAVAVKSGANKSTGYLEADIDMSQGSQSFVPIGTSNHPFMGIFDGKGYKIRNLHITGSNGTGFFGTVSGGAEISNFVLDSTCSIVGGSYTGLVGMSTGSGLITIRQVGNEALVTGNQNAAGIVGCNYGSTCQFILENCYNTGLITGVCESAGICGWMGNNGIITNCWNAAEVVGYVEGQEVARGSISFANSYTTFGQQVTSILNSQVTSGELCFRLNADTTIPPVWYQTLNMDAHPVFDLRHGVVSMNEEGMYYNRSLLLGDVNDDGIINVADLKAESNSILGIPTGNFIPGNADLNADGLINVYDIIVMAGKIRGQDVELSEPQVSGARLYASNASVKASGTRKVVIWLTSQEPITAYQTDIVLSDGLTIDTATIVKGNTATVTHLLNKNGNGSTYRILTYATDNAPLATLAGAAFSIVLQGTENFGGGTFQITRQYLGTAAGKTFVSPDVSYEVSLAKTYVSGIEFAESSIRMLEGEQGTILYSVLPATATDPSIRWSVEDSSVAMMDSDGIVTALSAGTTQITATALDGSNVRASIELVVENPDGILPLTADALRDAEIYTLSGLRVQRVARRGLYIVNGKKVLIR